jgi:hypothetical protein
MKKVLTVPFLLVSLLVAGAFASGCASSDIDALRSQLADVKQIAEQAQQQAAAASSAAQAAGNAATAAQSAADQAKTMNRATDEKVEAVKSIQDKNMAKKKR